MGRTRAERDAEVLAEAKSRFDVINAAVRDERAQCLNDRRFYSIAGAQWEGDLAKQFENRPRFEVNKVHLAVIRIINEYRNNRITADFVSKDGATDDNLADVCDGLFRADELDSCAEEAYDNAFEEAVGGGFGSIRLRAVAEEDLDDFDGESGDERQRIRIEPVFDADSCVFFDLDARRQDKADARFCFVLTSMTPEAYAEKYKDDPASWPKDVSGTQFDWATPDQVVVAEYYVVDAKRDETRLFRSASGEEEHFLASELDQQDLDELRSKGYVEDLDARKPTRVRRVLKYVLSGGAVLEGPQRIAGKNIPVVPVYGKRWIVDGVERCMGQVRLARDPQRLKNMQLSKLGELSAVGSTRKPIFTPAQVAGHAAMWSEDNIKNYPYLLVNPLVDAGGNIVSAGPTAYSEPPDIPAAMAALLQLTESDMQDILGNQQEADKMVSNISGEAIQLIQNRMDMQTYIYVSNFAKAVRRVGQVWLSMAREVYVEDGRAMKTVGESDEVGSVTLNTPVKDEKTGALTSGNDLSRARFDVNVRVGPSSSSKRAATVRALQGILATTNDPETAQVLSSMVMMNMEGEGVESAREYFRKKLVQLGVLKPTQEEAQAAAEAAKANQPDPNTLLALAMAQEAQAKAEKAKADAEATLADIGKTRAETLNILSQIDLKSKELNANLARLGAQTGPAEGATR